MKKLFNLFLLTGILCLIGVVKASAFDGSTLTSGQSYYLYNLYQSKFLQSDGSTLARTVTTADLFTASSTGFTIGSTTYTATVIDNSKKYRLVNGSNAFMFNAGSSCTTDAYNTDINASKSEWLLVSADEYATYAAKKRFTVASLNVDGMPQYLRIAGIDAVELNPDGKEGDGATAIGSKFTTMGYDVIGVSENFNYNSELIAAAGSVYSEGTHQGGINVVANSYWKYITSSSPVFDIDGLNLLWKTNGVSASNENIVSWNEHYGFSDNGADGLIDKGYRYYTVTLSEGNAVDVYILHMDAETDAGDIAARESQLTQLVTAIKTSNNGRPIIIMGDTNCRYTRDKLKSLLIDALNEDSRFTVKDPWIMYGRDGLYPGYGSASIMADAQGYLKGEVVDKVFYINNTVSNIRINALSYSQDLSFVDGDGNALADHWPAVVEFEYHTYDPAIDDATSGIEGEYYFRNVESGYFLKAGGDWGTHAVVGDYGTAMKLTLSNGKYTINSSFGNLYGNLFMDGSDAISWTAMKTGNYYVFNSDGGTLAVTGTACKYGPNEKTVGLAALNINDTRQQWELLTKDQMYAMITTGTAAKPFNCTHLMKFANFDRNDGSNGWTNSITTGSSVMTYKLGGDGLNIESKGNFVGEVYVSSYDKWITTYETTWNINQSLTVPNGVYKVTCQAFYRVNSGDDLDTDGTADVYLEVNSNKVLVKQMYNGAQCTDNIGSTTTGGYYYPNTMEEAAKFFNAGYYQNELTVTVTDGTLKVAIAKESTSKESSVWTCFDNFQIYYLGEIADGDQYYIYNVDEGGFLTNGNNANTQATLSSTQGTLWTAHITDEGYTFSQTTAINTWGASCPGSLFTASNGLYVDGSMPGVWDIVKLSDGTYNITSTDRSTMIGWEGDPGYDIVWSNLAPKTPELRGTRWAFMSTSDYTSYQSTIAGAFEARQSAWSVVCSSRANGMDYSAFKTVYDSPSSTADDINSAATTAKNNIISKAQNEASESNPIDVSFFITNPRCGYSDINNGWTNANFGTHLVDSPTNVDGALTSRFYEIWTASSSSLSNSSIKQTLNGLPVGGYKLKADGIAVKQDGNNTDVTGAILYIGDKEVNINTPTASGVTNAAAFTTPAFGVSDNSAEIGFKLENATANWVAIDNFRLYYVGGTKVNMTLSYVARKGTFCSPYDVVIPDNVTAYQVSEVTNNSGTRTLILSNVADAGETLIAGTPVIVCLSDGYTTEANLSKTYYGPAKITSDQHSDGYLCGVYTESQRSIAAGNYLLQRQDDVLAFYKIVGDPLTLAKYRAYLLSSAAYDDESSTGNSKLLMRFVDDEETDIESVNDSSASECESFYSVSGAKLSKLQHGINIIRMSDGSVKKVYIK